MKEKKKLQKCEIALLFLNNASAPVPSFPTDVIINFVTSQLPWNFIKFLGKGLIEGSFCAGNKQQIYLNNYCIFVILSYISKKKKKKRGNY